MTVEEYELAIRPTWNPNGLNQRDQIMNACLGLAGESGEVIDLYKKAYFHREFDTEEYLARRNDDLLKELGDTLYYLTRLIHLAGFTPTQVMQENFIKLSNRCPERFQPQAEKEVFI